MEFLIVIAVIIGIVILLKAGSGNPDVEKLTVNQMVHYTKSLQSRLDQLRAIPNRTEAIKTEIAKLETQLNHALSVWRRKIEE